MPDSCVNAFSPTMALLGWVWTPVKRDNQLAGAVEQLGFDVEVQLVEAAQ